MNKEIKTKKGTTLLEILLYFTILGTVLLAAMNFSIQTLTITQEADNIHEIYSNTDLISKRITKSIQEADSIDDANSIFENDEGAISLNVSIAQKSPTKIYLSEGEVYYKEGDNPAIKLTSNAIKCTKLRFQKIEYEKTPDQIIVDATFEPLTTDIKNLEQTMTFHTAISLRKL